MPISVNYASECVLDAGAEVIPIPIIVYLSYSVNFLPERRSVISMNGLCDIASERGAKSL